MFVFSVNSFGLFDDLLVLLKNMFLLVVLSNSKTFYKKILRVFGGKLGNYVNFLTFLVMIACLKCFDDLSEILTSFAGFCFFKECSDTMMRIKRLFCSRLSSLLLIWRFLCILIKSWWEIIWKMWKNSLKSTSYCFIFKSMLLSREWINSWFIFEL